MEPNKREPTEQEKQEFKQMMNNAVDTLRKDCFEQTGIQMPLFIARMIVMTMAQAIIDEGKSATDPEGIEQLIESTRTKRMN